MEKKLFTVIVAVVAVALLSGGALAEEYTERYEYREYTVRRDDSRHEARHVHRHGRRDRHHDDDSVRPWLPLGISIIAPPLQLPSPKHFLVGAMVNIGYGQMTDVAILDAGLINNVTDDMIGLEVGAINMVGTVFGAQVGALNTAETVCGAQVGVINVTDDLHGLQLGVLNFSGSGGAWMFPIINFGF